MNPILRFLWLWQSRNRYQNEELILQYPAIDILGKYGNANDFMNLMQMIGDERSYIRNLVVRSMRNILLRMKELGDIDKEIATLMEVKYLHNSTLIEKISLIELFRTFPLKKREELFGNEIEVVSNDLQYQMINTLEETEELEILERIRQVSETTDLVLKRKSLQIWYRGLENQNFDSVQEYATLNLHYLIRATYELQNSGEFLQRVLSYAMKKYLPSPLAYPDFIIRYLTELLGKWEYDPEAYKSLHAVVVPSYFSFNDEEQDPLLIL